MAQYYLRARAITRLLDRNHLSHGEFADQLGISRSYWSSLVNHRAKLSPRMRRRILGCAVVQNDVPDEELWQVVEVEQ